MDLPAGCRKHVRMKWNAPNRSSALQSSRLRAGQRGRWPRDGRGANRQRAAGVPPAELTLLLKMDLPARCRKHVGGLTGFVKMDLPAGCRKHVFDLPTRCRQHVSVAEICKRLGVSMIWLSSARARSTPMNREWIDRSADRIKRF